MASLTIAEKSFLSSSLLLYFYFFSRSPGLIRKKNLFLRRLSRSASFFLNLRNHMFSTSSNCLVPLSCFEVGTPPELGDRPRSRSQSARSSFAFFCPTSRIY